MSEGKIRPLIDRARREAIAESELREQALAQDLYAALAAEREAIGKAIGVVIAQAVLPLKARIERLEREVETLRKSRQE
jgi:hypothetical protein